MKTLLYIKNIIAYILIAIVLLIVTLPCMLIAALPERWRYGNRIYFFFANLYYQGVCRSLLLPINIVGREHIPTEPVIFVANHQSTLDIPLVGSIVGRRPHRWLVLSYYLDYPVLGFLIRRMNIAVEQDQSKRAARALLEVLRVARQSTDDLIIFPEGGRYSDGQVHHFYEGYALIAQKSGRPVVPIYIKNNYKILHKKTFLRQDYPLEATIGPAMKLHENENAQDFNERVRNWFLSF